MNFAQRLMRLRGGVLRENSMNNPINAESFMKFFEETAGVKFVDAETGKPALEILAENKTEVKSDYDIWLEQQDEDTKLAQEMGEL